MNGTMRIINVVIRRERIENALKRYDTGYTTLMQIRDTTYSADFRNDNNNF